MEWALEHETGSQKSFNVRLNNDVIHFPLLHLSLSLSHALFLLLPADATKICRNGSFSGGKIETRLVWGGKRLCDKSGSASPSHFPGNSSVTFSRQQQLQSPFCCSRVRFTKCQQMRIMRIYLSSKSLLGSQRPRREDMSRKVVGSNPGAGKISAIKYLNF